MSRNYPDSEITPVPPRLPTNHLQINLGIKSGPTNQTRATHVAVYKWLAIFEPIKEEAIQNGLPGEWRLVKSYDTPDGAITDASRMRKYVKDKKGYVPPGVWEFHAYKIFKNNVFESSEFIARYVTTPELSGNEPDHVMVLRGQRGPA